MEYTFSPVTDFEKLEEAISSLYGGQECARQVQRYQGLVEGFADTFGPAERLAVFSAPGRTEIGGNHTDHNHGRVLAGAVDLDIVGLTFTGVDQNYQYLIKGAIILFACALDMRKYLVKK